LKLNTGLIFKSAYFNGISFVFNWTFGCLFFIWVIDVKYSLSLFETSEMNYSAVETKSDGLSKVKEHLCLGIQKEIQPLKYSDLYTAGKDWFLYFILIFLEVFLCFLWQNTKGKKNEKPEIVERQLLTQFFHFFCFNSGWIASFSKQSCRTDFFSKDSTLFNNSQFILFTSL